MPPIRSTPANIACKYRRLPGESMPTSVLRKIGRSRRVTRRTNADDE
jgi:hypothetical protein